MIEDAGDAFGAASVTEPLKGVRFGALKAPGPSGARAEHLAELLGVKAQPKVAAILPGPALVVVAKISDQHKDTMAAIHAFNRRILHKLPYRSIPIHCMDGNGRVGLHKEPQVPSCSTTQGTRSPGLSRLRRRRTERSSRFFPMLLNLKAWPFRRWGVGV